MKVPRLARDHLAHNGDRGLFSCASHRMTAHGRALQSSRRSLGVTLVSFGNIVL